MKQYSEEEFLNEVLSIPTVNGVDDEGKLAWFLADYLKSCGVSAAVREIGSRHANVVGVLEGKTKEKVLWNGHLDTVPYGKLSEWNSQPERPVKKCGCIYARGASDMKSGLAAMVYTLGQMKLRGHVPRQTIYFLGTCDEEKGGVGAEQAVRENLMEDVSLLLVGEPTDCRIGIAQKGCVWLKLQVHGRTSHGAYPEQGVNAVEYGLAFFQELKERMAAYRHELLGSPTVQITSISGGVAPNMTPDEAELMLDIRVVPGMDAEQILKWSQEIRETLTSQNGGRLRIELRLENYRKALETDRRQPWVGKMERALRRETGSVSYAGVRFFTDASVLTRKRDDVPVLIMGPGQDSVAHKPNEYVEIKKYLQYIRLLNRLFLPKSKIIRYNRWQNYP